MNQAAMHSIQGHIRDLVGVTLPSTGVAATVVLVMNMMTQAVMHQTEGPIRHLTEAMHQDKAGVVVIVTLAGRAHHWLL